MIAPRPSVSAAKSLSRVLRVRPAPSRLASAALLAAGLSAAAVAIGPPAATATTTPTGQIPGSDRAYELVSPADAGGPVRSVPLSTLLFEVALNVGNGGDFTRELAGPIDLKAGGSAVFWESSATPPGSGAIDDGGAPDTFRSIRTPTGWSTQDMLPFGLSDDGSPRGDKLLVGASADGSSALIGTSRVLTPEDFANPQSSEEGFNLKGYIYRVSAGGATPRMVSHGLNLIPPPDQLPSSTPVFTAWAASPDLSQVAFASARPLESTDTCNGGVNSPTVYLWNGDTDSLAHVIVNTNIVNGCLGSAPNVNGVATILPGASSRPVLLPNPANGLGVGPLVESFPNLLLPGALTPLSGPSGATLLASSRDGSTAYVQAADALDPAFPGAAGNEDIYAMTTAEGAAGPVSCISCSSSAGGPDQTQVTYIATSADGSHVLFTTDQGLWEWDASDGAQLLTSATDIAPQQVVTSENGAYVVALTSQPLSGADSNGGPDLYELSAGRPPALITSGTSTDTYTAHQPQYGEGVGGVSDDGTRVVYNRQPAGSDTHSVIDEWVSGQSAQLSPEGSTSDYQVTGLAGSDLRDVFFLAHDPLVAADNNAGHTDIYDARVGGGFPSTSPASCDPLADACQGPPSTPPPLGSDPGSSTFSGNGNPAPEHPTPQPKKCAKGAVRKHGKCVRKCAKGAVRKHGKCVRKRHHTRHANRKPRTQR